MIFDTITARAPADAFSSAFPFDHRRRGQQANWQAHPALRTRARLHAAHGGNPLYDTADKAQSGVTHGVDITNTKLPAGTYDLVLANHVLEHVEDDHAAMRELFWLLKPGMAVLTVPINASRHTTYENPAVTDAKHRRAHFGADDHVRYYGLDFADRLRDVGFEVETFRLSPEDEVTYGLLRDEWLTVAHRT